MSDDKGGPQSANNPAPADPTPKVVPFTSAPSESYDPHSKLVRYWLDQRIAHTIQACLRQLQLIADAGVREQITQKQNAVKSGASSAAAAARAAGNEEEAKMHEEAAKTAANSIESKTDSIDILNYMSQILLHCATLATAKGYRELIRQALPTYNPSMLEGTLISATEPDKTLTEYVDERTIYERTITPKAWLKLLNARYYMVEKLGGTNMIVPKYRTITQMDLTPLSVPNFEHAGDDEQVFLGFKTIKGRKGEPDIEVPHFENPRAWWRRQPEAEKYDYQVFKPGEKTGGFRGGPYNTWTGWPLPVDKEMYVRVPGSKHGIRSKLFGDQLTAQWPTIADYLFRIMADSKNSIFQYLCHHLADMLQNPQSSDNIGIIFRGATGVGKTKFVRILRRFWGKSYIAYIRDITDLTGDFTGILQNKIAIFADDVFSGKDKKTEKILLALANSEEQRVRLMRTDTFYQEKYTRLYIADNENWVAPISLDDRRFTMFDVSPREKENHQYFEKLDAAIDGDECVAFFNFLLTVDLSRVNLKKDRPVTSALIEQMQHSLRGEARAIENMLQTGQIPIYLRDDSEVDSIITNGVFGSSKHGLLQVQGDCETIFCFTSRVYDYYRSRGFHFQSQTAFGTELNKLSLGGASVQRKYGIGRSAPNWRGVVLPPVTICRALFEQVWNKGRPWNWKEHEVTWANVALKDDE